MDRMIGSILYVSLSLSSLPIDHCLSQHTPKAQSVRSLPFPRLLDKRKVCSFEYILGSLTLLSPS